MKECYRCKVLKDVSEFRKCSRNSDSLDINCKKCKREMDKRTYNNHIIRNRKVIRESVRRKRRATSLFIIEFLSKHPCIDCGESDIMVLDFDHRGDKVKAVSDLARNSSIKRIRDEMDKCDVRCANCHRRKTMRENNSFKYQYCQVLEK